MMMLGKGGFPGDSSPIPAAQTSSWAQQRALLELFPVCHEKAPTSLGLNYLGRAATLWEHSSFWEKALWIFPHCCLRSMLCVLPFSADPALATLELIFPVDLVWVPPDYCNSDWHFPARMPTWITLGDVKVADFNEGKCLNTDTFRVYISSKQGGGWEDNCLSLSHPLILATAWPSLRGTNHEPRQASPEHCFSFLQPSGLLQRTSQNSPKTFSGAPLILPTMWKRKTSLLQ